jgi:CpeT protein
MTMKILPKIFGISLMISLVSINAIAVKADESVELNEDVNGVISHLVGVMDTSAQASTNPNAPNVRMTTCKITLSGVESETNSVYLYQEQALNSKLKEPYRQRFLEIKAGEDEDQVESIAFRVMQPQRWIGFCDRPSAQRQVTLEDLGEAVCSVSLRPLMTIYIGETPPEGCPTNIRGAVRITNTVILHSQGMDTYDRGFDAQGNQVWGAETEGYQFRWLTPSIINDQ